MLRTTSTWTRNLYWTPLADLGAVRVQGTDSVRFLQGQLSADVAKLTAERSLLAGLHTPQGRTIAIMRLIAVGPDDVLAVLPRELVTPVAARLAKFVLRSKVKVAESAAEWQLAGLTVRPDVPGHTAPAAAGVAHADLPSSVHSQARLGSSFVVRIAETPARWLVVAPADGSLPAAEEPLDRESWRALDIAAGLPQVYAATSELFVAQMLNLDLDAIGAIAFDKGCYTGQEIIARAHYRGRVKRRMQRFRSLGPASLTPGAAGHLTDGRSFAVVEAIRLGDGRCEFLAVAPSRTSDDGAQNASAASEPPETALDAEQLLLPYELPV